MIQNHQLGFRNGQHRIGSPLVVAEFDFKYAGIEHFDDGADLAAIEVAIWQVFGQR